MAKENKPALVQEYRRTCRQCGKVWHSLASREKQVQAQMKSNRCQAIAQCSNPGASLQAKRNMEANLSEYARLHQCPQCQSQNYEETVITFERPQAGR